MQRYKQGFVIGSAVLLVLLTAYAPVFFQPNSGLQNATAIAPYLNGTFTAEVPTPQSASASYTIENAFPNLTFEDPVKMLNMPNNQFMVISKSGYAWVFNGDSATTTKTLVLNVNANTVIGADGGMLGATLHPEFGQMSSPNAHYFYVWYRYKPSNGQGSKGYMRLSRFTINGSYSFVDPASEYVLIQQYDRHDWHNGGDMFFGLDGFLYLSIGDEGAANDSYNRTQSISDWLFGGVLRIDVDMQGGTISHPTRRQPHNNGATPPAGWPGSYTQGYFIPSDNPWLDPNGGILEEFWAIGTRSPHRMTLDPVTGNIWLGDIGQAAREEISLVSAGANLQWPYKEGDINGPKAKPSPLIGFDQPPVMAYNRSFGTCVIGGYVVRGSQYPELQGRYIFGDQTVQNIWSIELGPFGQAQDLQFLLNVPMEGVGSKDGISSFSIGDDGTVYILDLYGTQLDGGKIHKLVRIQHGIPDPPELLSQTGVFTDMATLEVAPGVMPYDLNAPLWSDGATKKRWIVVPNDGAFDTPAERIGFDADDAWAFPAGTVMIKHFELPLDEGDPSQTARLETRFMIYNDQGQAYGVTYRWNNPGTEAYLINEEEIGDWQITREDNSQYTQTWTFPSRQQCMDCHTANAGFALGPKVHQLNKEIEYPTTGVTANQLETWDHLTMFDQPLPPLSQLRKSYPLDDLTASAEDRVMSYLDANCAHCHRPNGAQAAFDSRYATPLDQKGLINEPTVGMNTPLGQLVVEPGDTLGSELWVRDGAEGTSPNVMPPLGKALVHEEYMDVLTEWIMQVDPTLTNDYTPLYIKAFLQGPYSNGEMGDSLRAKGLVPNLEPYTGQYLHAGSGGGETATEFTLSSHDERRVIDWVLVELRDAANSTQVLETRSALILSDGTVIDPSGGPLRIPTISNSYHVALRHRNHLGVMTAQPFVFNGAPRVIDFTDGALWTYGVDAQTDMSGTMAMWSGDMNTDGEIKYTGPYNDRDLILQRIGGSVPTNVVDGYHLEDMNLDGSVIYSGPGNDRDPMLSNIGGSVLTNVRVEQLP